eukprot:TRINITY_DN42197_c0_g1_i1.p1 TRINITY_DN42197_c0_g1~~TRINITY_DN42197_c0_g1_i1.p1  ORF type:complete len:515 (-),score=72.80 TRINITY_DN42197_c0_g1_i1:58-1602(-)
MGNSTAYYCCSSRVDPTSCVQQRPELEGSSPEPQQVGIQRRPQKEKHPRRSCQGLRGRDVDATAWSKAPLDKWMFREQEFNGKYEYATSPRLDEKKGSISQGMRALKISPWKYEGLYYQTSENGCIDGDQNYIMVRRTGSGFRVKTKPGGGFTWIGGQYFALPTDAAPRDDFENMFYDGEELTQFLRPGRGDGCADVPSLALFSRVDMTSIVQGSIGDCWLLSAISSLSEFDGVIERMFKKTSDVDHRPSEDFNTYTITLYDLPSSTPVDVVVNESLYCREDGSLLGCKPTIDGELWACYLEKAVAMHCGGWDKIIGGSCPHAWRLLTGCHEQFTIRRSEDDNASGFVCLSSFNPAKEDWEPLANSPHDSCSTLWPSPWPEVGGGGDANELLTEEELFLRMCAWEDTNYVMACSATPGSEVVADGHAYTILRCVNNAGSTDIHMVQVHNPWGRGQFDDSKWIVNGSGWSEHPEVKEVLRPLKADNGILWVDSDEFFRYFHTVYLCARDMSENPY